MGNIILWISWWFSPLVKKVIMLEHARNLMIRGRRNLIVPQIAETFQPHLKC
ncbi:hypothetical protein L873DRAFT_1822465, partial [Choiromyces venosus 120613-1]